MYQILPYIEEKALYDMRKGDGAANAGFTKTGLCGKTSEAVQLPVAQRSLRYRRHQHLRAG